MRVSQRALGAIARGCQIRSERPNTVSSYLLIENRAYVRYVHYVERVLRAGKYSTPTIILDVGLFVCLCACLPACVTVCASVRAGVCTRAGKRACIRACLMVCSYPMCVEACDFSLRSAKYSRNVFLMVNRLSIGLNESGAAEQLISSAALCFLNIYLQLT